MLTLDRYTTSCWDDAQHTHSGLNVPRRRHRGRFSKPAPTWRPKLYCCCVQFSRQPVVCGRVVFVRCICVCWAEIHWMYPPDSPRGRWRPGWPAEFRWLLLALPHPGCVCVCVCVCLCVCVWLSPTLSPSEHTLTLPAEFKCRCQVFSLNKAEETVIYWPPAALCALWTLNISYAVFLFFFFCLHLNKVVFLFDFKTRDSFFAFKLHRWWHNDKVHNDKVHIEVHNFFTGHKDRLTINGK